MISLFVAGTSPEEKPHQTDRKITELLPTHDDHRKEETPLLTATSRCIPDKKVLELLHNPKMKAEEDPAAEGNSNSQTPKKHLFATNPRKKPKTQPLEPTLKRNSKKKT